MFINKLYVDVQFYVTYQSTSDMLRHNQITTSINQMHQVVDIDYVIETGDITFVTAMEKCI